MKQDMKTSDKTAGDSAKTGTGAAKLDAAKLGETPSGRGIFTFLLGFAAIMIGGLFLLPTPEAASEAAAVDLDSSVSFLLTGARIFDGEEMHSSADLWVKDGRVEAIGEALEVPESVARIDGEGRTVLPGLIDAHVHAWGPARQDAARFGVTTMLDHFTSIDEVQAALRDRENGGATDRSDLFSAGMLATAEGGHGTQYGVAVDTVEGPEDAPSWVAARLEEGSDWIKIVVEPGWGRKLGTLDAETVGALIQAAHDQGALAVVHVSRLDDALMVAELGADGLVHVWGDRIPTSEEVRKIKDAGLFVVPTLVVFEGMADPAPSMAMAEGEWGERLSAAQRQTLEQRFPGVAGREMTIPMESVRLLHEAGVPILAGSDAPNPATAVGFSLHREMALLGASGLEPSAVLASATSVAAHHFQLTDQRGRLEKGALADLVLIDGDPLMDLSATRRLEKVWKAGHEISLEAAKTESAGIDSASAPAETLLADFDEGLVSRFGAGWNETTDQMRGGKSVVELAVKDGALVISGEIKAGAMFPWSGAMVSPGTAMMEPVDFSSRSELAFRVRGDNRRYSVMLFSGDMQGIPPTRTFEATPEWQTIVFDLDSFSQVDPSSLRGLAFTAGAPQGTFRFEIDDVEIR